MAVNDAEIHRIAAILAADYNAVEKREEIFGELGLPLGKLRDFKREIARDYSGSYTFFIETLTKYKEKNGKLDLIESLKKLQLESVLGNCILCVCACFF